jgi:hypothetical protein
MSHLEEASGVEVQLRATEGVEVARQAVREGRGRDLLGGTAEVQVEREDRLGGEGKHVDASACVDEVVLGGEEGSSKGRIFPLDPFPFPETVAPRVSRRESRSSLGVGRVPAKRTLPHVRGRDARRGTPFSARPWVILVGLRILYTDRVCEK